MVAVIRQHDTEILEHDELVALERMVGALCEHLTQVVEEIQRRDMPATREARLQIEAFEERRDRALELLEREGNEPRAVRIGNLEKLLEALECSWVFFNGQLEEASFAPSELAWSIRVT